MKQSNRRQFLRLAAGTAGLPVLTHIAKAQAYPSRPIQLVIPFPPGGAYDTLGRPWADKMKSVLGTVVVENIGGGGSSLGGAAAARAKADGYTLFLGGTLTHINETLLKARPLYNPTKDLEPIARLATGCLAIAVNPSLPIQTLNDFVGYAKANPGKLSYGHVGVGSTNHMIGELFKSLAAIPDVVQVPYRGAGPVMTDLISGQIAMGVVAITGQVLEFHRTGKLRVLAVTKSTPLTAAPEISTTAQAGFPRIATQSSYGLLAPAGTPKAIIEQIAQVTRATLVAEDYQRMLIKIGFEGVVDSGPEEFRKVLANDIEFWSPIVTALGLKID